ncbi:ABC transporter substrate-binding protein [Erwinia sp. S43]|uniref:ABC transporter substrate-binding protein n=1 Tax=Erwinia sp. S43 TaxID=2769339 RepID=UPI00351C891A
MISRLQRRALRLLAIMLLPAAVAAAEPAGHTTIRVATPWPAQTATIAMLGYSQNLVGTSVVAKRIPLLLQSYPGLAKVPIISANNGHEISAEQIIALDAQLLIVPESMRLAQPEALTAAGINTLMLKSNSMAALRERVTRTAQALGPDAVAVDVRYQTYFDRNVALIRERLKDLPPSERVSLYHSMGSPLTSSGRPSLNQDWMDLAGAHNVAEPWFGQRKNSNGEVSLEQVVAANPQVIVAMNHRDAEEIMHSPAWQGVAAVQQHRVYTNPQGMFWWCRETSEAALQILWLAKTLYPARFTDVDMNKEVFDFYHDFFGISLTPDQVTAILNPV